jgi:voltage-gated potassium channel
MALGTLIAVTAIGVIGFMIISSGEHGLIDAIYMTVITLTTVGFSEVIDMSNNPGGRMFTVVLLLGGMGTVAYTVPMLAAFVIEGQLHNIFARRRMQKTISQLKDHYIVAGDSAATWYAVEELMDTRRDVVLVTPSEELKDDCQERAGSLLSLIGDPSDDEVLKEAGIERAAGVVVSMRGDKDNVLGVISARRFNPTARIVAASKQQESIPKLEAAGADAVVSTSRIGGLRIASELVRPKVVSFLDQMLREKGGSLRVEEVTIPKDAGVVGKTLGELRVDKTAGVILLAVRAVEMGQVQFKPPPETRIEGGLTLIVMTDHEGRERLKASFSASP